MINRPLKFSLTRINVFFLQTLGYWTLCLIQTLINSHHFFCSCRGLAYWTIPHCFYLSLVATTYLLRATWRKWNSIYPVIVNYWHPKLTCFTQNHFRSCKRFVEVVFLEKIHQNKTSSRVCFIAYVKHYKRYVFSIASHM